MPPQTAVYGYDLLHNPQLNRGSAYTVTERRAYGLEGLLPPGSSAIELQVAALRILRIARLDSDLQKYLPAIGSAGRATKPFSTQS